MKKTYDYQPILFDFKQSEIRFRNIPLAIKIETIKLLENQIYLKMKFWRDQLGLWFSSINIVFLNDGTNSYQIVLATPFGEKYWCEKQLLNNYDRQDLLPKFKFETNLVKLKQVSQSAGVDFKISYVPNEHGRLTRSFDFNGAQLKDRIDWSVFDIDWYDLNRDPIWFNHHYLTLFINNLSEYNDLWKQTIVQNINRTIVNEQFNFETRTTSANDEIVIKKLDQQFKIDNLYYKFNHADLIVNDRADHSISYQPLGIVAYYQREFINDKIKCDIAFGLINWDYNDDLYVRFKDIANILKMLDYFYERDRLGQLNFNQSQQHNFKILIDYHKGDSGDYKSFVAIVDQNQKVIAKAYLYLGSWLNAGDRDDYQECEKIYQNLITQINQYEQNLVEQAKRQGFKL